MKINDCSIKIDSKQEFYDVETVCFNNGYKWYMYGHPRRDYSEFDNYFDGISINNNDMEMYGTSTYNDNFVTAKEFIKKYGKSEKRYRIKTKQEFIDKFGKDWRNVVKESFPKEMDFSLGKRLSKKHNQELIDTGKTHLHNEGYNVSMDMVILNGETKRKPTLMDRIFPKVNITLKKSLFNKKQTHLNQTL